MRNPTKLLERIPALCAILIFSVLVASCSVRKQTDPREGRPPAVPPTAPTVLSSVAGDGFSTLNWNTSYGATSYNLVWGLTSGLDVNPQSILGVLPPFRLTGLTNGTTVYFKVQAVNQYGTSSMSLAASTAPANGAGGADTLFGDQWHLSNTGQNGAVVGEDINVSTAWSACAGAATCRGEGVRIAVVDDGVEIAHEDLFANVASQRSYNYLTGTTDPSYSGTSGDHGHMCAGIVAARDLNGTGVRGVAPRANLVGYNLLMKYTTVNEADSMVRNAADVSISTNSWGAPDGTGDLAAASSTWKAAIEAGLVAGRSGLGTIYTWAAGNGDGGAATPNARDNSNHDGQANYRGVMAIGAVLDSGLKASYSERGANLLVSAPAGLSCTASQAITTVDRTGETGLNVTGTSNPDYADRAYTKCMNGTSAATPVVAGVIALMLQAKPTLGWRDVRKILATTARKNNAASIEWATNGAGIDYNHNFGFGVVDAQAAVTAAAAYGANLGTEETYLSALTTPALPIPDNDNTGVTSDIVVAGSGIANIEFIEVTFTAADHAAMEDLEVTLTNTTTASSAVSILTETHTCIDTNCIPYNGWVFGNTFHLNEPADGTWRLTVKDKRAGTTGTFQSWRLKFYGT